MPRLNLFLLLRCFQIASVFVSIAYFYLAPSQLAQNTYIDEHALMPGNSDLDFARDLHFQANGSTVATSSRFRFFQDQFHANRYS